MMTKKQQQLAALKALKWIEHIIETESGAEADSELDTIRAYILNSMSSSPITGGNSMPDNTIATTASLLREIADEMEKNPDEGFKEFKWSMRENGPFRINEDGWSELCRRASDPGYIVRHQPRAVPIGRVEVPEPMWEPPLLGTKYWCADAVFGVYAMQWDGTRDEYQWLRRGLCHRTREAAEKHVRAIILASGGEVDDE